MLGRVTIASDSRPSKLLEDAQVEERKEETEPNQNMETDRNALETGRAMMTGRANQQYVAKAKSIIESSPDP